MLVPETARCAKGRGSGLCPVVEEVMPRLVTVNLIFKPIEKAKRDAEKLHQAIRIMEE
jgi:hypothetical protein